MKIKAALHMHMVEVVSVRGKLCVYIRYKGEPKIPIEIEIGTTSLSVRQEQNVSHLLWQTRDVEVHAERARKPAVRSEYISLCTKTVSRIVLARTLWKTGV